ncbi:MAG: glycosyltransferase [Blastomonas sp.]
MPRPNVLYISYDGMLEPLGQSQVIAYLEKLADEYAFRILSFEKPADRADAAKVAALKARLDAAGIIWHPMTYHKSPSVPATLFDLAMGTIMAIWLCWRHRVRIIHARSYVPALMGRIAKTLSGAKLLFDMRGLWADERTDGGIWPPGGGVYRAVKGLERRLLLASDHVVTLTHNSAREIASFDYLQGRNVRLDVIPTCADLERFRPDPEIRPDCFTFGYLGSVGTWYMFDEVLDCFALIRQHIPDARLLVVNRKEQDFIRAKIAEHGIPTQAVEITSADHRDVPKMVARMSVGAAIIKPVYSKIASAPTKLAEYLGCGVPCLGNVGVGDMKEILEDEGTGVALTGFDKTDLAAGVERLLKLAEDEGLAARCREVALRLFSLDGGVADYRRIYAGLLA